MNTLKYLLTGAILICFMNGFSQPPPPGGSGPSCWPPPCVPVDQGWVFLFVAGIFLGIYAILKKLPAANETR